MLMSREGIKTSNLSPIICESQLPSCLGVMLLMNGDFISAVVRQACVHWPPVRSFLQEATCRLKTCDQVRRIFSKCKRGTKLISENQLHFSSRLVTSVSCLLTFCLALAGDVVTIELYSYVTVVSVVSSRCRVMVFGFRLTMGQGFALQLKLLDVEDLSINAFADPIVFHVDKCGGVR